MKTTAAARSPGRMINADNSSWLSGMCATAVKSLALIAISIASAGICSAQSDGNRLAVEEITSPDGHKFWYYSLPDADRTALAVTWVQELPVNSVHPMVARLGIDLMLNGGAGGRGAADIVADYQDLDSRSGLSVEPRAISGFIFAPNQHLSKAREIAQAVITTPAMQQAWFDREHQNLIEHARDDASNSWGIVSNVARELVIGDHPYNKFWSIKPLDKFEQVTLEDVVQWYESSFSKKTAIVAVAGSAASEVVAKELDLLLADLPEHEATEPVEFAPPDVPAKTVLFHNPDAPKSVVLLLGNLPPEGLAISQPLQLGIGVLGVGKQSRLFKALRSGLGASYGFSAGVIGYTRDYRMLHMSGEIETARLEEALKEIEDAYQEFHKSGVGPIEFPVAQSISRRKTSKLLQDPVNMAFSVTEAMRNGFGRDYVQKILESIDDMERSAVNEIIKTSMPAFDQMLKVIVTPDKDAIEGACVISSIEQARECLK